MNRKKLSLNQLSVKSFVTLERGGLNLKGGTNNQNNGDQSYRCQVTLRGDCGNTIVTGENGCNTQDDMCQTDYTIECTRHLCL